MLGNKDEAFIRGIVLTIVKDAGPEIIANLSPIPDENALVTALHLVSLAGLEDDRDEDDSKIIGPLPVKGTSELKSLYYSNQFKPGLDVKDNRIKMHGAKVGVILLFDSSKLPLIRRAAGLIEPYLEIKLNSVEDIDSMTREFAIKLKDHILDIISKPRLRTFHMDEEGVYEYKDPNFVNAEDDVLILDEHNRKLYFIAQKDTSVFVKRKMINQANQLNFDLYQGAFNVVTLDSFNEIEPLLQKHNIKVT